MKLSLEIMSHDKYLKDIENAKDLGFKLARFKLFNIGLKYIKNPNDVYGFERDILEMKMGEKNGD